MLEHSLCLHQGFTYGGPGPNEIGSASALEIHELYTTQGSAFQSISSFTESLPLFFISVVCVCPTGPAIQLHFFYNQPSSLN